MENKINKNNGGLIFTVVSVICSLVSVLVYRFLPESNLANGIEHSGMDAVYALIASPVFAFLALAFFAVGCIKLHKALTHTFPKLAVIGTFAVISLGLVFNFISSLLYLLKQNKLGFVAPVDGTVWDTLLTVMAVMLSLQCILCIVEVLSAKGIIKNKAQ